MDGGAPAPALGKAVEDSGEGLPMFLARARKWTATSEFGFSSNASREAEEEVPLTEVRGMKGAE